MENRSCYSKNAFAAFSIHFLFHAIAVKCIGAFVIISTAIVVIPTERSEWRDLRDQKTDGPAPLTMTNASLTIILPSESRLLQSKRKKQIDIPCRIVVLIRALKVFAVRLHPPGQP